MRNPHKYHAKQTIVDDIKFSSKLEAGYYRRLKMLVKAGELQYFLRQVPIHLPGNTKYVVDFLEVWDNGAIVYTDVKGLETPLFKMKKKQVEALYPIEINVIKKL